jgi:hypothetical protein
MMFTEPLAAKIVKGEKTQTRRRISPKPRSPWREPAGMAPFRDWTYPVGKVFTINPGRGVTRVAECEVIDRRLQALVDLTDAEAQAEGFAHRQAFFEAWRQINRGSDAAERVHVVKFKLVGPNCPACGGSGREPWSPIPTMFTTRDCSACFGTMVEVSDRARQLVARVEGA